MNSTLKSLLFWMVLIVVGVLIVLSGLAIWKPVQLQYLTALFGGYDVARYVHFFCMAAIVAFWVGYEMLTLANRIFDPGRGGPPGSQLGLVQEQALDAPRAVVAGDTMEVRVTVRAGVSQ